METRPFGNAPPPGSTSDLRLQCFGGPTLDGRFIVLGFTLGPVQSQMIVPREAVDSFLKILVETQALHGGIHVIKPG